MASARAAGADMKELPDVGDGRPIPGFETGSFIGHTEVMDASMKDGIVGGAQPIGPWEVGNAAREILPKLVRVKDASLCSVLATPSATRTPAAALPACCWSGSTTIRTSWPSTTRSQPTS